jgi:hypothetical protein
VSREHHILPAALYSFLIGPENEKMGELSPDFSGRSIGGIDFHSVRHCDRY